MYKLRLHKNLTPQKWAQYKEEQQILMIANELNRAKNWIMKNDSEETDNCYERAFELLDLTVSITEKNNLRTELLRLREELAILYLRSDKNYEDNSKLLNVLISLNKESYDLVI